MFLSFFLIRLYNLGKHDFWYDEAVAVGFTKIPWYNWNAPLYWMLLHFWIKNFSISETSLRFFSLLFSFSSVVIVYFLGKELFNKKTGVIASVLIGLSPFHIWYAQEARDYSMVLFLATLSSYAFLKALRTQQAKLWLGYSLISTAGLYTNYYFIILLTAQFLFLVLSGRFKGLRYFLIPLAAFFFYLPRFLSKFFYIKDGFWLLPPTGKSILITIANFIGGYTSPGYLYIISAVCSCILFILFLKSFLKEKEARFCFAFCFFLFVIPVAMIFMFSRFCFSIYLDRGLIIFSPYFYLILAAGLSYLRGAVFRSAVFFVFLLLGVLLGCHFNDVISMPFEYHVGAYIKKPIKPVVGFFKDNFTSGDIIAFTNESTLPSFQLYSGYIYNCYYFFDPHVLDTNWKRPYPDDEYHISLSRIKNLRFKRLWVIASDWPRSGRLDENSQSVKSWMDRKFKLEYTALVEGAVISCYVRG
ncbi:MAG: glycosyltransferase family 39 protein [Candidatus Omnitrophota bacterium]